MIQLRYVRFINAVDIGGRRLEYWSAKRGETDDLCLKIGSVGIVPDGRVTLTWTGGKEPQTIWVGAANVANWEEVPAEKPAQPVVKK